MTMYKRSFVVLAVLGWLVLLPGSAAIGQNLSGDYTMRTEAGDLNLVLIEDSNGSLSGTLTGTTGQRFRVDGEVNAGVGVGICYNDESQVYFEARLEGNGLSFAMIEIDAYNMPDYSRATSLLFVRSTTETAEADAVPQARRETSRPPVAARSEEEIGDPLWGFGFVPPSGWKWQQDQSGVLLGHDRIAGLIRVFPHNAADLQQLGAEMREGLSEEGVYLALSGAISRVGDNALVGDYAGVVQGEQAKARGIGTLSPYGGGAYVLALTTPEKFGTEIADAANAIASAIRYFKTDVSDLVRHFAGRWAAYTGNWGGGTLTNYSLFPDGTYSDESEVSYNTDLADSHMEATGISGGRGRWKVRGTKERGQIILISPDGEQSVVAYEVFVENGQTYWNEYLFDGQHFSKRESY